MKWKRKSNYKCKNSSMKKTSNVKNYLLTILMNTLLLKYHSYMNNCAICWVDGVINACASVYVLDFCAIFRNQTLQTWQRRFYTPCSVWQLSNWVRTKTGIKHRERGKTEIWWNYDWIFISDCTCSSQVYGKITWRCSRVEVKWENVSTWVQGTVHILLRR